LSIGSFVCLAAGLSAPAGASVIYSYVTDASSYTGASAGSIVPVNIYLQETLTGSSTSYVSANGGMTGAGAGFNVTGTTGGTAAQFAAGSFTFAPSFGGPQTADYNQGSGNNLEFSEGIVPGAATVMPGANGRILLGTLNVTAGSGKTSYILTSLNNDTINSSAQFPNGNSLLGQSNGNTTTQNPPPFGSDLDLSPSSGAYTGANASPGDVITVSGSSVPEPASLAVFGVGAMGLLARRRRSA
jgi:PEP-CTERM motif